ncbi:MAG: flagellar type III secretion system protein FliQ [Treponema sp.]|nr:flagellar type III secretion system protein FliQ [Treponema sp.]
MSIGEIVAILRQGIFMTLQMAIPLLGPALLVGLVVAILQATTSIQEQTLTLVPKLIVILLVLFAFGGLGFTLLGQYTANLFSQISIMAR